MATIVLSAVGASLGASIGGGLLGLSSVVIGRAAGAIAGSMIDQAITGGGSQVVEHGKVDRFRLTGVSEGAPMARVYGRMRMGGQVIWSSGVKEHANTGEASDGGSGKGMLTGTAQGGSTVDYRYSLSLAIALCEGEITHVGRVWADGEEIEPERLNMRVYPGSETQQPDPKIEAVKGAGNAPGYRGVAYVVIEDLDITAFGNRVPVLNFEVFRPEQPDEVAEIARGTRAVAIIPGTGEYALATSRVHSGDKPGEKRPINENTPLGKTDFAASLDMLDAAMPALEAASLVVSWFGDDLRCNRCEIKPLVESSFGDGHEMPWHVSGLDRASAGLVPQVGERPVYGGTPTDQSVVEAIAALKAAGKAVTFYPFILMTQTAGNTLTDPWTGEPGQPSLPWRGRITTSRAPGVDGSPDQTAAASDEVDAFFGSAARRHFSLDGTNVRYDGPDEWSYRRFILHYACLCKAAGGVDAFLIGSELRGLTQIRSGRSSFPAVARLRQLAGEVRAILGAGTRISYAADWSEYFGYHPQDGSGDLHFHLDPLWASADIDFIGIDNYMPLSDWRDGADHADAGWGSIYDLDYLKSNILGGEGYDWYYRSGEAEALQLRSPISDGAYGKDWVYRYKDLVNWWRNPHVARIGGVELTDLPLNSPVAFDGTFADGDAYWLAYFRQNEAELATDPGFVAGYSDASLQYVPGEGNVIQVGNKYRIMSERGWRPFIEGQEISATIRTRVLAVPSDGNPHRCYVWITTIGADGDFSGYWVVGNMLGLSVADGWVDMNVTFTPYDLRGVGQIAPDAKGWRLMIGFNGYTPDNPAGALQQVSRISIEARNEDSGWMPGSKPIWFTEIGCAAIDKGTNQPNKFLDPKSSESSLPKYSSGARDDFIQMRYLRALNEFWADPVNNPTDAETGVQMLDMSRAHVWAWDARPFPWFPARGALWSDGANYSRGHWLNGRETSRSLASVVSEICTRSGVAAHDVSGLHGVVRGYAVADVTGGRNALQPLMLAHGFDVAEREGVLAFFTRTGLADGAIDEDRLALNDEIEGSIEFTRSAEAETAGRVRLNFIEANGGYEARATEAIFPDEATHAVSQSELAMVLTGAEGRAITERWLAEARVARDGARFALPPSALGWRAGDVARLDLPGGPGTFRIDQLEQGIGALARAVRVEPGVFRPAEALDLDVELPSYTPPVPVLPLFLDLPLLSGEEVVHAPHLAVTALPWPGPVAVYRGQGDAGYKLVHSTGVAARIGVTETVLARARPGVLDRGAALRVRMTSGDLASAELSRLLSGANAAAIGDGTPGNWEVFQFTTAQLVEAGVYELSGRLRGQAGTDATMPEAWPVGSYIVMLDAAVGQIAHPASLRGLERDFRIGPAARPYDDDTYVHLAHGFEGIGLRPLAPVHLAARRGANGDLAVSWVRRTRVGGDDWGVAEVPLGEDSERYLVRVMGGQTVLREAEASTPGWSYSAAMQAADGVTAPFAIEVAQVSARFGPGPFGRAVVTG
jgi:GTA TIM-barrel-like domain/Putative phage tail protein